jgi:hemimethylated DNA binding protein
MDPKQLPHILTLLDDESPLVRSELQRQLEGWGEHLKIELARLSQPPSGSQRRLLQNLMEKQSRQWLKRVWPLWLMLPDNLESLEKACALISEFQTGYIFPTDLSIVLDELVHGYKSSHPAPDALSLAAYLFKDKCLQGNQADYFNPLNSDLVYNIKEKRGIPLSLATVYMLAGWRVGLNVQGCHFPGHFLARVEEGGRAYLVDCFNGGSEVDFKVVAAMSESTPWGVQAILDSPATPRSIVGRMLRNLAKAYEEARAPENVALMAELSVALERDDLEKAGMSAAQGLLHGQPLLATGQIVLSKRWGFRAVIVDFDLSCKAPEAWRKKRAGGASLEQPWYHLFVDGSDQVAYASEDSLQLEAPPGAVQHTLLKDFFDRYENGKYWRNSKPWPGTQE